MPSSYVVDAHALIWYIEDNPRMGSQARAIMDDPESVLFLPVIALAECCWIVEHGRSSIPSVAHLVADVDADPRISVVGLDRAVLDRALELAGINEMHDRLIVATALELAGTGETPGILTKDAGIRESGRLPVVW